MSFWKRKSAAPVEPGPDETLDEAATEASAPTVVQTEAWTAGRAGTTKVMTILLGAAIACGPVAVVMGMAPSAPVASAPAPVADQTVLTSDQQSAGSSSVAFVQAWLSATRDTRSELEAYLTLPSGSITAVTPTEHRSAQVASIDVDESGDLVTTTVAVEVGEASIVDEEKVTTWVWRYYQVTASTSGGGVSILSLPAQVEGPSPATLPKVEYDSLPVTSSVGESVQLFLATYLAGGGDISRFLTPGTVLEPLDPAPYASVRLTQLSADADAASAPADGEVLHVRADVEATTSLEQPIALTYWLTLTARADRWEVTSIDSGPAPDSVTFPEATSEPPKPTTSTPEEPEEPGPSSTPTPTE